MSAARILNPTICQTDEDVRNKIFDITLDSDTKVIFPTGYPQAFVGLYWHEEEDSWGAVFSENKILDQLAIDMKDPTSDENPYDIARDFFEFNIAGSHFSDFAPVLYIRTN